MADDGLLINFDLGDSAAASSSSSPNRTGQKFKGGSWKDRHAARKAAQYGQRKRQQQAETAAGSNGVLATASSLSTTDKRTSRDSATGLGESGDFQTPSAKRQRVGTANFQHHLTSNSDSRKYATGTRPAPGKPHEVISSLFSFNPKATTQADQPADQDATPAAASNAPLSDELATFTNLGLSPPLAEHLLRKMEIKKPTAIQRASIPQLVKEDTDAFLQAETGSGKTLAYLLPIVQRLMSLSKDADQQNAIQRDSGLFAIVLAPTRELSKQISVVLESLLRCAHWIVCGTVLGGEKKKSEKARLRKGVNILIATPGRLVDHLDNTEVLNVSRVKWLVLDEGDRLMELGFEQDIAKILAKLDSAPSSIPGRLPGRRTTVLCSATMKMQVQKLGELSLRDAVHIQGQAGDADDKDNNTDDPESRQTKHKQDQFLAPAQLQQSYVIVPAKLRLVSLTAVLKRAFARRGSVMRAMVFLSCADTVDLHFEVFSRRLEASTKKGEQAEASETAAKETDATNLPATAFSTKDNPVRIFRLHGSLAQHARTSTLAAFRTSKDPAVMVCTDVAARGLDLPNIDLVVEYDPPFNKDDHLHRIGRTARAGRDGRAMIFLLPGSEEGYIDAVLKQGRHDDGRGLVRSEANDVLKKGFGSAGIGAGNDWEDRATDWQLDIERWALESPRILEMARRGYQSHIRAYATHVAPERKIFDMQTLHLGHLAKAFALRDKPGSIRVPGLRPTDGNMKASRAERKLSVAKGKSAGKSEHDVLSAVELDEARRKMRAAQKKMSGASEFNLA